MHRPAIILLLLAIASNARAQAESPPPPAADAYQGAFKAEEQQRAADLWKALLKEEPDNTTAQWNYFVSSRNASMARNDGRLPESDQKQLKTIAEGISSSAPNSFEAHMARFHLQFPDREAFAELNKAAAIAPTRPEIFGPQLARAMMDGDERAIGRWTKEMDERGNVSPALLAVASDLLHSIDPEGIVFTNGEMDTYPTLVRQRVFGYRKDVLVIDQRLLADASYRQRCWGQARAGGSPPGPGVGFVKALLNATTRPVFLALSLDPSWTEALRDELYATGIALRYSHSHVENIPELDARWRDLHKPLSAGPLSMNYLLPGSVLLLHYRAVGDEARAARIEYELRGLAEALKAMPRLYQLGIIEH